VGGEIELFTMSNENIIDFIADFSPTLNARIKRIQSFDVFEKANIYMHYYITQISLKHDFKVVDTAKDNWQHGWSKPDETFKQIAFFYLWEDVKIKTIDEFYSDENIKITDCGVHWQEKGFAQRHRIECSGVYDWFWKFESQFNLGDQIELFQFTPRVET
jgi:hypothetical protein